MLCCFCDFSRGHFFWSTFQILFLQSGVDLSVLLLRQNYYNDLFHGKLVRQEYRHLSAIDGYTVVCVWHPLTRRKISTILLKQILWHDFHQNPNFPWIALLLQLTTGRTQLNRSYLLPLDFFEHWSTAVWNFELLCDQEVHEVEWGFGGIGMHYMRCHILCISWTQVYKSAQAGVSSNPRGTLALSIRVSVIFQKYGIWNLKS